MIEKIKLSEKKLYCSNIDMPKGFEIERPTITSDIFLCNFYKDYKPPHNHALQKIITYVCDFMRLENKLDLIPHSKRGMFFEKNENSDYLLEVDPTDLKNSPDFVMLYGVEIDKKTCEITIQYDDNRRVNKNWNINLENNKFIIFPSVQKFKIKNVNNSHLNFVQLVNFEYL
jgi:hypothetical protein